MDHRVISGIIWIGFAIVMLVFGAVEVFKNKNSEGVSYIILGVLILAFQFYTYKRTGKVGGIL
ncbi:MAG: hypothetical protein GXO44_04420 [Deferribacteres bacterium]|nr:hypothetical protein [Deferribacteres bacterium]